MDRYGVFSISFPRWNEGRRGRLHCKPERHLSDSWPTLVIEAGYTQSLPSLRSKMRWWFNESNGDVKIVVLAKLYPRRQAILLEKYIRGPRVPRPGATNTRRSSAAAAMPEPNCHQEIWVKRTPGSNPATYVATGALILEFPLLFLHQADPARGERNIVINVPDLQEWSLSCATRLPRPKSNVSKTPLRTR